MSKNDPAFPVIKTEPTYDKHRGEYANTFSEGGLTKREWFAAMAMQGLIANKANPLHFNPKDDAKYCAAIADALIAELERTCTNTEK